MELMNFLQAVPVPVLMLVVIVLLAVTIYIGFQYAKEKQLDGLREKVYELILRAEHAFDESGEGKMKLKWVVQQARGLLPGWLKIFVSEDMLTSLINGWFLSVKDLLDDGKVNGSQKAGTD